jgi:hypothetical protein
MAQTVLSQDQMPNSAAQHCHNKNKRKNDGTIETLQWYLPAIGELQHIMSAAYTDFEMFQNNSYWSSQTSYRKGYFHYYEIGFFEIINREGEFLYENEKMGRSTKALYLGNDNYTYEPSDATGISKSWEGWLGDQTGKWTETPNNHRPDSGNKERTKPLRVRAVYKKYTSPTGASGSWTEITESAEQAEYDKLK